MKIRLTGTRQECAAATELVSAVLQVREVSDFYPNRPPSTLGRVYLDAEPAAPDRADRLGRPARQVLAAWDDSVVSWDSLQAPISALRRGLRGRGAES